MNLTNLRKILLESLINPQAPGKMKIIFDAANPDYFVSRAGEAIRGAQSEAQGSLPWHNHITTAITLLAMARLYRKDEHPIKSITPTEYAQRIFKANVAPEYFSLIDGRMRHVGTGIDVPVKKWKATLAALAKIKQESLGKDDHGA